MPAGGLAIASRLCLSGADQAERARRGAVRVVGDRAGPVAVAPAKAPVPPTVLSAPPTAGSNGPARRNDFSPGVTVMPQSSRVPAASMVVHLSLEPTGDLAGR